jgi:hypothetical protein
MAHYKSTHPWNPGYAIPDYIRAESPGRAGGVHTTMQLPRGTFDNGGKTARPWRSGFAVPGYIQREPIGRGAAGTWQRRRKTIPLNIPRSLGATEEDTSWLPAEQTREEFETINVRTGKTPREVLPPKRSAAPAVKKAGIPPWAIPLGLGAVAVWFVLRK